MGKNLVKKTYYSDCSWTAPAGVTTVWVTRIPTRNNDFVTHYNDGTGNRTVIALNNAGVAYSWGAGTCGSNGRGNITPNCQPAAVSCGFCYQQILGLYGNGDPVFIGLTTSGDLYSWGSGFSCGVLGNGTTTSQCTPQRVCCNLKVKKLTGTWNSAYALTYSGDVYAWGSNTSGQLGIGNTTVQCQPQPVCGGIKFRDILANSADSNRVIAISVDNDMYHWGSGACGVGGNCSISSTCCPTLVLGGIKWRSMWIGNTATYGISLAGDLYAWGSNLQRLLGTGQATSCSKCVPTQICAGLKWKSFPMRMSTFKIGESGNSMFAISAASDLYSWGANLCGYLGNGTASTINCVPTLVCGGLKFASVFTQNDSQNTTAGSVFGITTSGDLYAWGANLGGVLGVGDTSPKCCPTLVCCGLKWRSITASGSNSGGGVAYGLTTCGDLYAWGSGNCGMLGNNTASSICQPGLVCCGFKWNQPPQTQQRIAVEVVPGATYNMSMLGGLGLQDFDLQAVSSEPFTDGLLLEYFA